MFDQIFTYTLSDFLVRFPEVPVPDQVRSDPSLRFVRVGFIPDDKEIHIEYSDASDNWEHIV